MCGSPSCDSQEPEHRPRGRGTQLYLKGPGLDKGRDCSLSHPVPCRLAGRQNGWHPQPPFKGHQKPDGLPHREQRGPFVSPLTPSLFSGAKGSPAAHMLAVLPPRALGQPLDFVPCQEAGAVKTGFSSCPAQQGLGIWAKKPAGPKVPGKVHECSHA